MVSVRLITEKEDAMQSIKKFFSKFLNRHPLIKKFVDFVDLIDSYTNKPIVYLTGLVGMVMFFLVTTETVTVGLPSMQSLRKYIPGIFGSFSFFLTKLMGIVVLLVLVMTFFRLVAETGDLRDKKNPMRMEIVTVWSIIIGVIFGGGFAEYLKYSKKQDKRREQDAREEARIAEVIKACENFPEEKICKVPLEERDASWTYRVLQCFTTEATPYLEAVRLKNATRWKQRAGVAYARQWQHGC